MQYLITTSLHLYERQQSKSKTYFHLHLQYLALLLQHFSLLIQDSSVLYLVYHFDTYTLRSYINSSKKVSRLCHSWFSRRFLFPSISSQLLQLVSPFLPTLFLHLSSSFPLLPSVAPRGGASLCKINSRDD